jgi:hypothetical protein
MRGARERRRLLANPVPTILKLRFAGPMLDLAVEQLAARACTALSRQPLSHGPPSANSHRSHTRVAARKPRRHESRASSYLDDNVQKCHIL